MLLSIFLRTGQQKCSFPERLEFLCFSFMKIFIFVSGRTERQPSRPSDSVWKKMENYAKIFGNLIRRKVAGDPKSRNGGITERQKITPKPKRWNRGITERRKLPPISKRRNDGKSTEVLKDGSAANQPKS